MIVIDGIDGVLNHLFVERMNDGDLIVDVVVAAKNGRTVRQCG